MIRIPRDHYTYRFAADVPPVARIQPGDEVIFETYDASTGRIRVPEQAAEAIRLGAGGVVVGSAITRPEHITGWFATAVADAVQARAA